MSILIKGLKMPACCDECRFCEGDTVDGLCHAAGKWFDDEYFRWFVYAEDDIDESKPINCPLVKVPTPHGRLIDADDIENITVIVNENGNGFTRIVAPTIIKAEEGE